MPYRIPPDIEQRIKDHLAYGNYTDEGDVLRDAIRALDAEKTDIAAIQAGIKDMEAGRTRSLDEFDREFRQKHNIK